MSQYAPSPPNAFVAQLRQRLRDGLLLRPINRIILAIAARLPKAAWFARLPVALDSVTAKLPDNTTIIMGNPGRCHVAQELHWHDGCLGSAQDRQALKVALRLSHNAKCFVDVGAYSGLFALAAARVNPDITAYAYEIVGENYLLLQENILRNDLADRVIPRLVAIGPQTGEMRTPFAIGFSALTSSVALDWDFETGLRIPVRRLDDLFPSPGGPSPDALSLAGPSLDGPVVMKIDVEGFEMEVFDGAEGFLTTHKPDIVCEVLRRARRVPEMMQLLTALGYRWLHITEHGLQPKAQILADKHRRDWLFTTKTDAELAKAGLTLAAR